jgi:hypothetical protein
MENLSPYVYVLFGATVMLSAWLFIRATHYARIPLVIISAWILLQSALGLSGFYDDPASLTARFPLLVAPPIVFLTALFLTRKGKTFIDGLDIRTLTLFHLIRIPVEIVLLLLFIGQSIPEAMTFEGRNLDILSGLSAPVIYYLVFVNPKIGRTGLILWNIACIALLLNVVTNAVLSLPDRYLQFGFEQPNVAVGCFPFLLLPALLVPLALFSNAAAVRQLLIYKKEPSFNHPSKK